MKLKYTCFYSITQMFAVTLLSFACFNLSFISDLIEFFMKISFFTGQLLVNKFLAFCDVVVEVVKLISIFFQVIYEDSFIFISDAEEKAAFIVFLIKEFYFFLEKGCQSTYSIILYIVTMMSELRVMSNIVEFWYIVVTTTKESFSHIGSSIWLFFISFPQKIMYAIKELLDLISMCYIEGINSICFCGKKVAQIFEQIYLFFFDIPLDSVYGLLIGVTFAAVICIKFKEICSMMWHMILMLYYGIKSLGNSLWTGEFLKQSNQRSNLNVPEDDERLCIICKNQLKEIIIFPCKHLCLCWDCSNKITNTYHTCPLCRNEITDTLKVYI